MNKKIMIIIPTILVLILAIFITINMNDNKNNNKKENITEKENNNSFDNSNINMTTNSFTLSDGKTQISIKIENLKDKDISINEILIQLYNSSNEKIVSLKEKTRATIKVKESIIIDLTLDKMYAETAEIKYEILS